MRITLVHVFSVNADKMCGECNYAAVFVNMFMLLLERLIDLDACVTL